MIENEILRVVMQLYSWSYIEHLKVYNEHSYYIDIRHVSRYFDNDPPQNSISMECTLDAQLYIYHSACANHKHIICLIYLKLKYKKHS